MLKYAFWAAFVVTSLPAYSDGLQKFPSSCGLHCGSKTSTEQSVLSADALLNSLSAVNHQNDKICSNPSVSGSDRDAVNGARILMTQMYGSCDVLKLPVREFLNPFEISSSVKHMQVKNGNRYPRTAVTKAQVSLLSSSHPYLQSFFGENSCSGICKTNATTDLDPVCLKATCLSVKNPPTYQYGGKAPQSSAPFAIQNLGGGVSNGIDCSGFIAESLQVKGLKMKPGVQVGQGTGGTGMFASYGSVDAAGNPTDCFESISRRSGIKSGDILIAPNNHMVMIDAVGDDPFGIFSMINDASPEVLNQQYQEWCTIKKTKPQKGSLIEILNGTSTLTEQQKSLFLNGLADSVCQKNVNIENFQITIMHSSPHGNRIGVQRERVSLGLEGPLETMLEMKARRDCIQALRAKWMESNPALLVNPSRFVTEFEGKSKSHACSKIIRHRSKQVECVGTPMPLNSLSCSSCCELDTSYQEQVPGGAK
jgi:hypothetical protein